MQKLLLLTGLLLLACGSFFFSPAPTGQADEEYWGTYAQVNSRMGFVINGDTREYIAAAREPARLLQEKEVRQSRPLYILLGSGLGYALQPVLGSINVADTWGGIAAESPDFLGFYAGYVLLNFVVLLASLYLFVRIGELLAEGPTDKIVLYGLGWFLVSNPITKAFFWTAHQQMFAFFTPLLYLYGLLRYRTVVLSWRQSLGWALGLGALALVYGNFVLGLPCLLYQLLTYRARYSTPVLLGRMLAATACFVLPTFAWIGLLKLYGVTYYNQEAVRFHQFTWMLDAWRESPGTFFSTLSTNLLTFWTNLGTIQGFLLAALLLGGLQRWRGLKAPAGVWPVLGFVFLLFFAFYALIGYYPERLTFTLVPILLCVLALLLLRRPLPYQRLLVLLAALSWHWYVVSSYGPFS
ncbi:hypothetical protein [Hymenobacter cavernae]|uniref:Glycosyltransferase RgtA/B/C/D-like domain-containing protein n=1 Tax=Hymenobacter cavernae TaxID=2044852 RepID=A0ABQ1TP36_9BACT|nr:hypothetical protein [Hymenobacter cavernae]GGE98328.1 hypothetical protein GCM10011383_06380 [Hymenobacter cavernae]